MITTLMTAATGMIAQQTRIDVTTNDLANADTNGYKGSDTEFSTLLSQRIQRAGTEVISGQEVPAGIEIGLGVRVSATPTDVSQGTMKVTERPLDIAIQGEGYFQVQLADGSFAYTRDGSFKTDSTGQLVTSEGLILQPSITIPSNAVNVTVGIDGTVSIVDDTGTSSTVGNLTTHRFINPVGLSAIGNNLYAETGASGTATSGTPGSSGFGELQQGFLEGSNVKLVVEMVDMITGQRAYEAGSRGISTGDDMLRTATQLKR